MSDKRLQSYMIQDPTNLYNPGPCNSVTACPTYGLWGIKRDDAMVVRHSARVKLLLGAPCKSSNFSQKAPIQEFKFLTFHNHIIYEAWNPLTEPWKHFFSVGSLKDWCETPSWVKMKKKLGQIY